MSAFRPWAFRRRIQYAAGHLAMLAGFSTLVYFIYFYSAATCFDGAQNGAERGVDCGGACSRICAFEVIPPQVAWAKSFKITNGQYNAVAYIENKNVAAATPELNYKFKLFAGSKLIAERAGKTVLPPNSTYPIFEGRINTGDEVPTETVLEISPALVWVPSSLDRSQFETLSLELKGADARPRLNATLYNKQLIEARDVEVVATIFNAEGVALTSSQTFIDRFVGRSEADIVFTWPEPIAKTLRSCEIPTDVVVAIDLSGSMNNDGGDPPQPLTAVKEAASQFVGQLNETDQVGVVTFATMAEINLALGKDKSAAQKIIESLSIDLKEEVGSTNTGDGLLKADDDINSAKHNPDARKVVVLLTDGLATAPDVEPAEFAKAQAEALKAKDTTLYTIGLGQGANMDFLRTIASSPEDAYAAPGIADLSKIYQTITSSICEEGVARIDVIPKTATNFAPLR